MTDIEKNELEFSEALKVVAENFLDVPVGDIYDRAFYYGFATGYSQALKIIEKLVNKSAPAKE